MALGIDGRWHELRADGRAWCLAELHAGAYVADTGTPDPVPCAACPRERDIAAGREPTAPGVVVEVSELGGEG